jgi:signal transduction histidine kinase
MKSKLSSQILRNFWVIFLLTILATVLAFVLLSVVSIFISGSLVKSQFSASEIIKEDYRQIDASAVVENGGGVQIVDKEYRVVYSHGVDTIGKDQLTIQDFTTFLTESKSKPYHYDIIYQPRGEFWLIVTFPTSIRLDFKLVHNKDASTGDFKQAAGAIAFVVLSYLLILALFTFIYSRITAARITVPLKKLCDGTRLLREGDYSARVDLRLKNEFAELQNTFNEMAARIEYEIALRQKSEEDRRRLILDISHDLKNPLSSIQGYAEMLCQKSESPELTVIHQNSQRANRLLNELFELSKMDSPDFALKPVKTAICVPPGPPAKKSRTGAFLSHPLMLIHCFLPFSSSSVSSAMLFAGVFPLSSIIRGVDAVNCEIAISPKFIAITTAKNNAVLFSRVSCLGFALFRICAMMRKSN